MTLFFRDNQLIKRSIIRFFCILCKQVLPTLVCVSSFLQTPLQSAHAASTKSKPAPKAANLQSAPSNKFKNPAVLNKSASSTAAAARSKPGAAPKSPAAIAAKPQAPSLSGAGPEIEAASTQPPAALSSPANPSSGSDFGGGQKALEIRGQSRKLDMLQTLKTQDDDLDYVKPRKNYKNELETTLN